MVRCLLKKFFSIKTPQNDSNWSFTYKNNTNNNFELVLSGQKQKNNKNFLKIFFLKCGVFGTDEHSNTCFLPKEPNFEKEPNEPKRTKRTKRSKKT